MLTHRKKELSKKLNSSRVISFVDVLQLVIYCEQKFTMKFLSSLSQKTLWRRVALMLLFSIQLSESKSEILHGYININKLQKYFATTKSHLIHHNTLVARRSALAHANKDAGSGWGKSTHISSRNVFEFKNSALLGAASQREDWINFHNFFFGKKGKYFHIVLPLKSHHLVIGSGWEKAQSLSTFSTSALGPSLSTILWC